MNKIDDVKEGSLIEIKSKDGKKYKGILLKRYEFADKDYITLKLENGYNVSLKKDEILDVIFRGKIDFKLPSLKIINKSDKNVLFISTGGTIASKIDYITGGVVPTMDPEHFLAFFPELINKANFVFKSPMTKFSEDMEIKDWELIAKKTLDYLSESNFEGIILTHGTDTLHYTASALSFVFYPLEVPIALTAAQRSSDRASSDSILNVLSALEYILGDYGETAIVMHKSLNDDESWALRGVKTRKMHSSRRDSFRPINDKEIVNFYIDLKEKNIKRKEDVKVLKRKNLDSIDSSRLDLVKENINFEEKVALIKYYPTMAADLIDSLIDKNYKGVIIEGTGFGHISANNKELLETIRRANEENIFIGMTTQTIYGSTNSFVYATARKLNKIGVCYLYDMLPETALVKLSWLSAKNDDLDFLKENMLKNYSGEINFNFSYSTFLK